MICNILVRSLFVYMMSVLPFMPQKYLKKLDDLMTDFIWEGKRDKIILETLQMSKDNG